MTDLKIVDGSEESEDHTVARVHREKARRYDDPVSRQKALEKLSPESYGGEKHVFNTRHSFGVFSKDTWTKPHTPTEKVVCILGIVAMGGAFIAYRLL